MALRLGNITMDCANALELGSFWAAALGRELDAEASEEFASIGRGGASPTWFFIKVPEPKTAKNRTHLDLVADDVEVEVERLRALGATRVEAKDEWNFHWTVMADPSGNEFCVSGPH